IVDNSNVGTVVDITGPATGLAVDQQVGTAQKPDGATFAAGGKLIVVATAAAGMPNGFSVTTGGVVSCTLNDNMAMPLSAAAIAADATNLYAWTKTGVLLAYPLTAFDTMAACTNVAGSPVGPMISPAPMNGAYFALSGSFAVLASLDTAQSMTG